MKIILLLSLFIFLLSCSKPPAGDLSPIKKREWIEICRTNLEELYNWIMAYRDAKGKFPSSTGQAFINELIKHVRRTEGKGKERVLRKLLMCPMAYHYYHVGIHYEGPVLPLNPDDKNLIILSDRLYNHSPTKGDEGQVLLMDGTVKELKGETWRKAKSAGRIGF
jgi:hypothetical protein